MEYLLRECVTLILSEADRGGISAQHVIVQKFKNLFPGHSFVSNKKGQQSADVTILLNDKVIGAMESKSIQGGGGLTALFDITVSLKGTTVFDGLAAALAEAQGITLKNPESSGESMVSQFLSAIGGSAGTSRPIPKDLKANLTNPVYNGYSHRLISTGEVLEFRAEPGDTQRAKDDSLVIFKNSSVGVKAYMTVKKIGKKLITSSSPRAWATSGTIPASGGISEDVAVRDAAYSLMKEHFAAGGDNYFVLVDGDTIYPFIVPGSKDPLKLAKMGVPYLSPDSFVKAGLSTYGNAGVGKIRLALKAAFSRSFSL